MAVVGEDPDLIKHKLHECCEIFQCFYFAFVEEKTKPDLYLAWRLGFLQVTWLCCLIAADLAINGR